MPTRDRFPTWGNLFADAVEATAKESGLPPLEVAELMEAHLVEIRRFLRTREASGYLGLSTMMVAVYGQPPPPPPPNGRSEADLPRFSPPSHRGSGGSRRPRSGRPSPDKSPGVD